MPTGDFAVSSAKNTSISEARKPKETSGLVGSIRNDIDAYNACSDPEDKTGLAADLFQKFKNFKEYQEVVIRNPDIKSSLEKVLIEQEEHVRKLCWHLVEDIKKEGIGFINQFIKYKQPSSGPLFPALDGKSIGEGKLPICRISFRRGLEVSWEYLKLELPEKGPSTYKELSDVMVPFISRIKAGFGILHEEFPLQAYYDQSLSKSGSVPKIKDGYAVILYPVLDLKQPAQYPQYIGFLESTHGYKGAAADPAAILGKAKQHLPDNIRDKLYPRSIDDPYIQDGERMFDYSFIDFIAELQAGIKKEGLIISPVEKPPVDIYDLLQVNKYTEQSTNKEGEKALARYVETTKGVTPHALLLKALKLTAEAAPDKKANMVEAVRLCSQLLFAVKGTTRAKEKFHGFQERVEFDKLMRAKHAENYEAHYLPYVENFFQFASDMRENDAITDYTHFFGILLSGLVGQADLKYIDPAYNAGKKSSSAVKNEVIHKIKDAMAAITRLDELAKDKPDLHGQINDLLRNSGLTIDTLPNAKIQNFAVLYDQVMQFIASKDKLASFTRLTKPHKSYLVLFLHALIKYLQLNGLSMPDEFLSLATVLGEKVYSKEHAADSPRSIAFCLEAARSASYLYKLSHGETIDTAQLRKSYKQRHNLKIRNVDPEQEYNEKDLENELLSRVNNKVDADPQGSLLLEVLWYVQDAEDEKAGDLLKKYFKARRPDPVKIAKAIAPDCNVALLEEKVSEYIGLIEEKGAVQFTDKQRNTIRKEVISINNTRNIGDPNSGHIYHSIDKDGTIVLHN